MKDGQKNIWRRRKWNWNADVKSESNTYRQTHKQRKVDVKKWKQIKQEKRNENMDGRRRRKNEIA